MNKNNENLKEILSGFYPEAEAAKVEQDILAGDKLLADNPTPKPDTELINRIKSRINVELAQRQRRRAFRYVRATVTAAAAVLIIGVTLFMIQPEQPQEQPSVAAMTSDIPQQIWESEDLMNDDVTLAMLAADIDAVEDEVFALRFDSGSGETINLDEVEIEFVDIGDDFWKG
ncbi:MAG: hypothetical protein WC374_09450 [Phycisphaerae bacterium]|jgi:anti-sigma-K factor RskA